MIKPDDIPQRVWDAARALIRDWESPFVEILARAIMAETSLCASVAGYSKRQGLDPEAAISERLKP